MKEQRIPIFDVADEVSALWDDLQDAIQTVLRSGHFIMGPNVQALEREIAGYLGVKHAVGLNSGTDALFLALRTLGVKEGDEVITTPFTFFATAEAISHVGAVPIFVDVDPDTYLLDVRQVEKAITSRTKAIIPVHLFGQMVDMDAIMELARTHKISVVEDVAQAFGSRHARGQAGTIGHVGTYSFFPTKNLGAYGDGGLLVTADDGIADVARMLRSHGSKKKYHNEVVGYNSRLDEIQAAILRVKLPHVDRWNEQRRSVAHRYNELLREVPNLVTPTESPHSSHVFHQYTVRIQNGKRDRVRAELALQGVDTMVYYPIPVHQLPVYRCMELNFPIAERLATEVLSLPMWPSLSAAAQEHVAALLRRILS